jgi:hypothetical protein
MPFECDFDVPFLRGFRVKNETLRARPWFSLAYNEKYLVFAVCALQKLNMRACNHGLKPFSSVELIVHLVGAQGREKSLQVT